MVDVAFYNDKAAIVKKLFGEKGRSDLKLRRETAGGYDPGTDTETDPVVVQQDIICIVLPVSKGVVEAFDNRLEGGTLIESNMRLLKIAALDLTFEPRAGDVVPDLEGAEWTALGSTPLSPAGITLLFNVTVKRG